MQSIAAMIPILLETAMSVFDFRSYRSTKNKAETPKLRAAPIGRVGEVGGDTTVAVWHLP